MIKTVLHRLLLALVLSSVFGQRILLITKTDDVFSSSNIFTIKNKRVVFWDNKIVLTTVPIRSLVEVRYAEDSYKPIGNPCVFTGKVAVAAGVGASTMGQMDEDYMKIGIGGGLVLYFIGKTLNFIGARFGKDVVYYNFDRLDFSTKALVLESIILDLEKRKKEKIISEFIYGPEGEKQRFLNFAWKGKNPWRKYKRHKPKKKIIRFSFF